ncbi:MAG: tetratricopeptide repeat protein, partial [Polyangiaceae bacterium]
DPIEKSSLLFELGRIRMLRGDHAGAVSAFETLAGATAEDGAGLEGAAWLGRALATYAVGIGAGPAAGARDPSAFQRLSEVEPDAQLARGLLVVAAMHAAKGGQRDEALQILGAEHGREPGDLVVAVFLAELRRRGGDAAGAAAVLSTAAEASGEPALGGALQLEAGLTLWGAGDRSAAIAAFENALVYAPSATNTMLSWALRAASPDDPEARLRAIELAEQTDDDRLSGALERLGLAVKSGGGDADLVGALATLDDLNPGGDVALATALARVLVSGNDQEALDDALSQIEQLGGQATVVARAERYRVARFVERDAAATLEAAARWSEAEPSLAPALEWLASAQAGDDRDAEIAARSAVVDQLDGPSQVAAATGLALLRLIHHPAEQQELVKSEDHAARLMNLELGPPGAEPVRRATVLRGIGASLGEEAARQAARLAAWSDLASGSVGSVQKAFKALVEVDGEDMASWEGLRAASKQLEDHTTGGVATARLANLCKDDGKAAELWEEAGLILLEHTDAHDDAEIAFRRSLERDHTRAVAFDKLFRRVRARKDNDQLLKLIKLRLQVTENELEITKMYWERARVYRDQGDNERALEALNDVTMLEPDHVGALALSGEVAIKQGKFDEAAPRLARLATLDAAPKKQRLLSGIAAVDLYEKKLGDPAKALEVLLRLYRDGLSTGKVRERLARAAARLGKWNEAVELLERLMKERDSSKGRKEAARLAMAIYRDKLQEPGRAAKAVARLLEEDPANKEAVQLLLVADVSKELTQRAIPHAKQLLLTSIASNPFDRAKVELVAQIAEFEGDPNLRRAALGCALALGTDDGALTGAIAAWDARAIKEPQIKLDDAAILAIADPQDVGPTPELFVMAANVIAEAMGPNTKSEDVGRRQRVDGGNPVRVEVSRWMGALGFDDFDVYVGGRDPSAVKGLADDKPGLVVGAQVGTPDDEAGRSAVAREVFALRRGTTAVMYCDDTTIASIVIAICKEAGANVADPPYAIYKEIERVIHKAMSRRVRKAVADTCQRVVSSGQDPAAWAAAARRSIDRMAAIASGGAASVIDSTVGPPGSPERQAMANDQRAKSLLSFVMSSEYLELRRKLGMGVA